MIKMAEEERERVDEVRLLNERISALERALENSKPRRLSIVEPVKRILRFISDRIFSRDNIGLVLSLVSIVMSSCVVAYLVLK